MDFPKSVAGVGLVAGQFVDEDKAIPRPGSLIPAKWGNDVTNEILGVLAEAGFEPDEDNVQQLRRAVKAIAAEGGTAFGLGDVVDLQGTPFEVGIPSDVFGAGTRFGLARGGSDGLSIPAFGAAVNQYGALTVLAHRTQVGLAALSRTFERDGRIFKQYATQANAWGAWLEVYTTGNLDVGALAAAGLVGNFARTTPPAGWFKANGAAVSRTTYASLFAAIGTTFGAGDGATTFNLPDLRAETVRGWDDGRGIDAGRAFGSYQSDALQNITGTMGRVQFHTSAGFTGALYDAGSASTGNAANGSWPGRNVGFDASLVARTSHETRMRNIALLACIKY